MAKCKYCGIEVDLPFICKYCGMAYCADHRLPERHECVNLFQAKPPEVKVTGFSLRSGFRYGFDEKGKGLGDRELRDLLIAWVTLSFCFSTAYLFRFKSFLLYFGISLVTLGAGFIAHELAHRSLARRYGCIAEFRAWPMGLLMALIFALLSRGAFIFAAPGAVYIGPKLMGYRLTSKREIGSISLVGPISNALIGLGFLGLSFIPGIIGFMGTIGFRVNIWLAAFNLIPLGMMDGYKIFSWSPKVWAASAIPIWIIIVASYLY